VFSENGEYGLASVDERPHAIAGQFRHPEKAGVSEAALAELLHEPEYRFLFFPVRFVAGTQMTLRW
jgi:hypothetical protein